MNHQLYSLDQINELVKVGLINIPTDNILESGSEIDYSPENINNFQGELCMEGKVVFHGGRWKIDFRRRLICGYITRDARGVLFWNKEHALQSLNSIRYEVTSHVFDIEKYRKSSLEEWQFDNLFNNYISAAVDKHKTPWSPAYKTLVNRMFKKYYFPFFGKRDLRDLEDININQFYDSLPDSLCLRTKKQVINILKAFFNSFKIIRKKQLEFPSPKVNEPIRTWIDKEDQNIILEHIPNRHKPVFQFLIWHGVRPGEARALMWDCVNLNRKEIIIKRTFSEHILTEKTKGKRDRVIPIYSEFLPVLKSLPRTMDNFFVFRGRTGKNYGRKALRKIWNEAVKDAGLAPIKLYNGTRHSCASQLLKAGADLSDIQELLGHSKIEQTKVYAHAEKTRLARVIEMHSRSGKKSTSKAHIM